MLDEHWLFIGVFLVLAPIFATLPLIFTQSPGALPTREHTTVDYLGYSPETPGSVVSSSAVRPTNYMGETVNP